LVKRDKVIHRRRHGVSLSQIADEFGISKGSVFNIVWLLTCVAMQIGMTVGAAAEGDFHSAGQGHTERLVDLKFADHKLGDTK
jgi:hypothetical protein